MLLITFRICGEFAEETAKQRCVFSEISVERLKNDRKNLMEDLKHFKLALQYGFGGIRFFGNC